MDKSKFYLNLSKLSKEQRKNIAKVFFKTNTLISSITLEMLNRGSIVDSDGDKCFTFLMKGHKEWSGHTKSEIKGKTELTYPEFIRLFEGGEKEKERINSDGTQVETFVQRMEKEMKANEHKGDWKRFAVKENRIEILDEIRHHYDKLVLAFESNDEELIREHSADIGNIAMFMYESTNYK